MRTSGVHPSMLRDWRVLAGLSQIELGRRTMHTWKGEQRSLDKMTINAIESDPTRGVTEEILVSLANVLTEAIHNAYPTLSELTVTSLDLVDNNPNDVLAQMRSKPRQKAAS